MSVSVCSLYILQICNKVNEKNTKPTQMTAQFYDKYRQEMLSFQTKKHIKKQSLVIHHIFFFFMFTDVCTDAAQRFCFINFWLKLKAILKAGWWLGEYCEMAKQAKNTVVSFYLLHQQQKVSFVHFIRKKRIRKKCA